MHSSSRNGRQRGNGRSRPAKKAATNNLAEAGLHLDTSRAWRKRPSSRKLASKENVNAKPEENGTRKRAPTRHRPSKKGPHGPREFPAQASLLDDVVEEIIPGFSSENIFDGNAEQLTFGAIGSVALSVRDTVKSGASVGGGDSRVFPGVVSDQAKKPPRRQEEKPAEPAAKSQTEAKVQPHDVSHVSLPTVYGNSNLQEAEPGPGEIEGAQVKKESSEPATSVPPPQDEKLQEGSEAGKESKPGQRKKKKRRRRPGNKAATPEVVSSFQIAEPETKLEEYYKQKKARAAAEKHKRQQKAIAREQQMQEEWERKQREREARIEEEHRRKQENRRQKMEEKAKKEEEEAAAQEAEKARKQAERVKKESEKAAKEEEAKKKNTQGKEPKEKPPGEVAAPTHFVQDKLEHSAISEEPEPTKDGNNSAEQHPPGGVQTSETQGKPQDPVETRGAIVTTPLLETEELQDLKALAYGAPKKSRRRKKRGVVKTPLANLDYPAKFHISEPSFKPEPKEKTKTQEETPPPTQSPQAQSTGASKKKRRRRKKTKSKNKKSNNDPANVQRPDTSGAEANASQPDETPKLSKNRRRRERRKKQAAKEMELAKTSTHTKESQKGREGESTESPGLEEKTAQAEIKKAAVESKDGEEEEEEDKKKEEETAGKKKEEEAREEAEKKEEEEEEEVETKAREKKEGEKGEEATEKGEEEEEEEEKGEETTAAKKKTEEQAKWRKEVDADTESTTKATKDGVNGEHTGARSKRGDALLSSIGSVLKELQGFEVGVNSVDEGKAHLRKLAEYEAKKAPFQKPETQTEVEEIEKEQPGFKANFDEVLQQVEHAWEAKRVKIAADLKAVRLGQKEKTAPSGRVLKRSSSQRIVFKSGKASTSRRRPATLRVNEKPRVQLVDLFERQQQEGGDPEKEAVLRKVKTQAGGRGMGGLLGGLNPAALKATLRSSGASPGREEAQPPLRGLRGGGLGPSSRGRGRPPSAKANARGATKIAKPTGVLTSAGETSSNAALKETKPAKTNSEVKCEASATARTICYEDLKAKRNLEGCDRTSLELYLADEEFANVFGMDREKWNAQPKWKRDSAKKAKGLF